MSQRFIDLLNVPLEQLRAAGEEERIPNAASMPKWPLAERLAQVPRPRLETLAAGYLYAGRTSLSFFRLDDPVSDRDEDEQQADSPILRGASLDPGAVVDVLNELSESGNAFDETTRPSEVTTTPTLVIARRRDDGSVLLSFAVQKAVGHVIHDFQQRPVLADDFFNAVLYPDDGLVEVRTNQQTANRFRRSWLSDFVDRFEELESYPVSITLDDIDALKQALDADLFRYRGKQTSGNVIDTVEIKAMPNVDLDGEPDFQNATAGLDPQLSHMRFQHDGGEYSIRVSRLHGSIYFVTPAPEEAIDYVRDTLRRIKTRHLVP